MKSTLPETVETLALVYKQRLLREANLESLTALPRPQLRDALLSLVKQWLVEEKVIISRQDQEQLLTIITDEATGFGPLESLLSDPDITEIMVNRPDEIWIERQGRLHLTLVRFKDEQHVRHILERIVAPIGRRVDESCPMVDARLPDGSRVNGVIPPVSLHGPVMTIRKFRRSPWQVDDLVCYGSLSADMAHFLRAAITAKQNLVISGGTGSGKTSLLTAIAGVIPHGERVITIEDMAELRLERQNVVSLEAKPSNVEGKGEIPIRSLVRNALRMRPDRVIVGEVRGDEALDMLQAMNTGHEGSLTTIHANNPRDALARLEAMVIMANSALSVSVIREHLVSALDLVIQTERLSDGSRKVVSISEVLGVSSGQVEMAELFRFDRHGLGEDDQVLGEFVATGIQPRCIAQIKAFGITLPEAMFSGR